MQSSIERIEREIEQALDSAGLDAKAVDQVRIHFLGRKGQLPALMKQLRELPSDQRKQAGQTINTLKRSVEQRIELALERARGDERDRALRSEQVDTTLPGRAPWSGSLHPVTRTRAELERVFSKLGFTIEDGPEVEDDFHNFQALNMPPDHPARDATDTFYLADGNVLRTHTSPVQIRTMESQKPPIKMVCPGRVYRRDLDATHLPMFHQLEALVVAEGVTMADLKGTLEALWEGFYGPGIGMRLRPGYFPFVEPGCEYDISCQVCNGSGCRVCKNSGWIELGGAGMVHPAVFEAVGIDPTRYSGFAFGLGIDRIAMMRYGIDDLRLLLENDVRFLAQFQGGC